jgi:gas vesicle protein
MNRYTNEEMSTGSGAGTFVIGALCGVAVGAAIGMLFAPKSGRETRQQLAEQTERLRRTATEQADWLRQRASEAIQVGKDAYNKTRPNGNASESTIG